MSLHKIECQCISSLVLFVYLCNSFLSEMKQKQSKVTPAVCWAQHPAACHSLDNFAKALREQDHYKEEQCDHHLPI